MITASREQVPEPFPLSTPARGWPWHRTLLLLAVAATAVVAPMFFLGQASGHDIQFHLASWMETARQWHEGIFYPRWAEWANWGFGEPRFIFYPPASWMAGAALGSLLPWKLAPGAFIWLTLLGAGMAMWKLSREYLPSPQAECAAVFFAVNPYNLVIIYYRSDYAELLAIAFFPLLVLYALRLVDTGWRCVPSLAAIFAAIWLSNAPAGVIATYSLVLILAVACVARREILPLASGGTAMACGFGLAAFYILPAAWERRWVQIQEVVGGDLHFDHNFLFTHSTDSDFQAFNWKVSYVAVGVILFSIAAAALSWRKQREHPKIWWTCTTLGIVSALLMTQLSVPLWNHLPELHFIQFPWRWLGPLDLSFAFLAAASIGRWNNSPAKWLVPILVLGITAATATRMVRDAWWDSCDAPFISGEINSQHGYEGTDEYAPVGTDRSELSQGNPADGAPPKIEVVEPITGKLIPASAGMRLHVEQWSAERKNFTVGTPGQTTLALHLLNYPAWEAHIDGNLAHIDDAPDTAQMWVTIPAGNHRVEIRFRRTWDRTAGDLISAFFEIGLVLFARFVRKPEFTV